MTLKAHKLPIGGSVDRWRIVKHIGRGTIASVYLASDETLDRPVAIKVLHADPHDAGEHSVERLRREVTLAQRIDDPGVCKVLELATVEDLVLLVMEFVEGQTLRSLLATDGRLSPTRTAHIGASAAAALAAAHAHEVLHRDLKPGNLMVRIGDRATILDFGYAIAPDITRLTRRGSWVGTLAYAAPELLKNTQATIHSDIYSLGVILYECLTGELPFLGDSYGELASAILGCEVVPPSRLSTRVGRDLDDIVLKAMSREPTQRHANAKNLAAALATLATDSSEEVTLTSVGPLGSDEPTAVDVPAPEQHPNAEITAKAVTAPRSRSTGAPADRTRDVQVPVPTPQAVHDRLAVHRRLADLSAAIMRERQSKGLIVGDSSELDGLEKTAQEELRVGNWSVTIACLERALAAAQAIAIDDDFMRAKLERFGETLNDRAQPHNQQHFRGLLERARTAFANGDLSTANHTLNRAFDTLRAK